MAKTQEEIREAILEEILFTLSLEQGQKAEPKNLEKILRKNSLPRSLIFSGDESIFNGDFLQTVVQKFGTLGICFYQLEHKGYIEDFGIWNESSKTIKQAYRLTQEGLDFLVERGLSLPIYSEISKDEICFPPSNKPEVKPNSEKVVYKKEKQIQKRRSTNFLSEIDEEDKELIKSAISSINRHTPDCRAFHELTINYKGKKERLDYLSQNGEIPCTPNMIRDILIKEKLITRINNNYFPTEKGKIFASINYNSRDFNFPGQLNLFQN